MARTNYTIAGLEAQLRRLNESLKEHNIPYELTLGGENNMRGVYRHTLTSPEVRNVVLLGTVKQLSQAAQEEYYRLLADDSRQKRQQAIAKILESFPEVRERMTFTENDTPYQEGDRDFVHNNFEACVWFLENCDRIRELLQ